jgi:hypothetical protein
MKNFIRVGTVYLEKLTEERASCEKFAVVASKSGKLFASNSLRSEAIASETMERDRRIL